jgi:2-dehydro-3-deoxyphosphogluconate aldolase / (4S)-4-hydroxy-2-oxoglutarate aldolase
MKIVRIAIAQPAAHLAAGTSWNKIAFYCCFTTRNGHFDQSQNSALNMAETPLKTIAQHRLVPVIELDSAAAACSLAEALLQGGLPVMELTFRTGAAAESIAAVRKRFPEMLVGAGTIVLPDQLRQALDAGAQFLVSPGFDPPLAQAVLKTGILYLPGVATASELQSALALGINTCKFFPAEQIGGARFLRVLADTFRAFSPRFVPTGGINLNNVETWLAEPSVIAAGGSWLAAKEWIRDRDWFAIQESVASSVRVCRTIKKGVTWS